MKLIWMNHANVESRKFLRPFLEKSLDFEQIRIETDTDPDVLYHHLIGNYYADKPTMLLLIGVDDEGKIVSHLIGQVEEFYGARYFTVLWYAKDHGYELSDDERWEIWDFIKDWAIKWNIDKVRAIAQNETNAEIFLKYGLKKTPKVYMEMSVK